MISLYDITRESTGSLLVGCADGAEALAARLELDIDAVREDRIYEIWDRCGTGISERPRDAKGRVLDEACEVTGYHRKAVMGKGEVCVSDAKLGRDRTVTPDEVVRRNPEVIVASWCGKAVRKERIAARVGWYGVAAVRDGRIYEIKSAYILQPGPAALTEGLRQLHGILSQVRPAATPAG